MRAFSNVAVMGWPYSSGPGVRPPGAPRAVRRVATGAAVFLALAAPAVVAGPSRADQALAVRDFVLARGIAEREPIETVDSFDVSDQQGYVFTRLANDGPPTGITVVWRYEGTEHAAVDLEVGTSSGWRTWSSANLKAGQWTVELRDAQGVVLAERDFTVGAALAEDPMPAADEPSGAGFEQVGQDPATRPGPDATPRSKSLPVGGDG